MLTAISNESAAVVIVSNGPGELATWVKPVLDSLIKQKSKPMNSNIPNYKLVLTLVPCPNATGKEFIVANNWQILDLIIPAKHFLKLLINPTSFGKWPRNGVVVFLGGDQFWNILLAKRLGYQSITYAEWIARWPRWNIHIAAMNEDVRRKLPKKFQKKCQIIGDLMADVKHNLSPINEIQDKEWIAILPGSKKAKLSIGIPFFLEVADLIKACDEKINILIPIAPTAQLKDFIFFQSDKNPISKHYSSNIKSVKKIENSIFDYVLETYKNSKIFILNQNSNHNILSQCKLALTTVGANTAELAAINLPMIVVFPTQHISAMNAWDGIFGIIGKIPFLNRIQTFLLKRWYLKNNKFLAWPNIKANKQIIPERVGIISPKDIAEEAIYLLNEKNILLEQKNNLLKMRGKKGAIKKLSNLILETITNE